MLTLATKFIPYLEGFEVANQVGFRAAEFWLSDELLRKSHEIAKFAEEFPFRYALHFPNEGVISSDILHSIVTLYRNLHCTAIIIHQPMFDRHAKDLLEIDSEVDLAIENHVLDLKGVDRWADENPGLTLDVEHLWKFTLCDAPLATLLQHVERILSRHAEKLQHVHLPGYLPGGEEHCPIHQSPEMAAEVMTRLAAHGFSKLVVSEADTPFQTEEFLRKDVLFFENWLSSSAASSVRG